MTENQAFLTTIREAAQSDWSEFDGGEVLELIKIIDAQTAALERIADFDLTQERSGVNVAVLQGIARDALYGPD